MSASRILFVRNSRGITDVTGAETYLLTLLDGLRDSGCEVHILCADMTKKGQTAWQTALEERDIPHTIVDVPKTFSTGDFRAVASFEQAFGADVIHSMDHRSNAVAVRASRKLGIPAVASFFGWTNFKKTTFRGMLYPMFDRYVMRNIAKVIVDSAYIGEQIRSDRPDTQVAVIRNGVNLDRFDVETVTGGYKEKWFGRSDVTLVGMIGRVHPNKGQLDMAQAAADMLTRNPDLRFVVIGDPPLGAEEYAAELDALLGKFDIRDKFLVTNVPSVEIPKVIASFDITAIPSYMESLSYVMLESMAMKKPVISARVGGHGDLIQHGVNGFLHESGDVPALTELVELLAGDPSARARIGQAGYDIVIERYSTRAMIAQTRAVYVEVTGL